MPFGQMLILLDGATCVVVVVTGESFDETIEVSMVMPPRISKPALVVTTWSLQGIYQTSEI